MSVRTSAAPSAADFVITYHGTVATLDVLSGACGSWVEDNVAVEPWQRLGVSCICVEPRLADELREALSEAGFHDHDSSGGEG